MASIAGSAGFPAAVVTSASQAPFSGAESPMMLASLAADVKVELDNALAAAAGGSGGGVAAVTSGLPPLATAGSCGGAQLQLPEAFSPPRHGMHRRNGSSGSEVAASSSESAGDAPPLSSGLRRTQTGGRRDPANAAKLKEARNLKKRAASKARYMDQKNKLEEMKARASELQTVNAQLKSDLADVYQEIERLQAQGGDDDAPAQLAMAMQGFPGGMEL